MPRVPVRDIEIYGESRRRGKRIALALALAHPRLVECRYGHPRTALVLLDGGHLIAVLRRQRERLCRRLRTFLLST
jgi:hypothetical protein